MTLFQRVSACALLVTGMLGVPAFAYPLFYREFAVAALIGVGAATAVVAFWLLTRTPHYSRVAATIAALVALVVTVDALGGTDLGKTGTPRTALEQSGLLLVNWVAGLAAAFAASFVKLQFKRPVRSIDA